MNVLSILKKEEHQHALNTKGYVKLPFANREQVSDLLALYKEVMTIPTDIPRDILFTCIHNTNKEFVKKMTTELKARLLPLMQNVLTDFKFTSFTFQIKGLGEKSELFAHQDWSFCDEKQFRSYTFWLPLHDCFPENGTVYVLPGSHKKLDNIRGAGITSVFEDVKEEAKKSMIPINIKAGELLIFDSALAHFSPPNYTDKERVSVMSILTQSKADFVLFFGKNNNSSVEISSYKVANDFLESYDNFKVDYLSPPKSAEFIGTEEKPAFVFTKNSFAEFANSLNSNKSWFEKIKLYFS